MFSIEQCVAPDCKTLVEIRTDKNGGLPIAVNGFTGLTDDGDAVCRDHFCPTCGNYHADAAAFEQCEFDGCQALNMTLCGVKDPFAVLASYR